MSKNDYSQNNSQNSSQNSSRNSSQNTSQNSSQNSEKQGQKNRSENSTSGGSQNSSSVQTFELLIQKPGGRPCGLARFFAGRHLILQKETGAFAKKNGLTYGGIARNIYL